MIIFTPSTSAFPSKSFYIRLLSALKNFFKVAFSGIFLVKIVPKGALDISFGLRVPCTLKKQWLFIISYSLAKHSRLIFSNFSHFGSFIFQGRLTFKVDYL